MTEARKLDIAEMQSECLVGYSEYANISTIESSRLFREYNLFEFISKCYDVLHLDSIEDIIKNDIAYRIENKERFTLRN